MPIQKFSFFDEFDENEIVNCLQSLKCMTCRSSIEQVLEYLKNGHRIASVPGLAIDYLSDNHNIIGPPNIYTDG